MSEEKVERGELIKPEEIPGFGRVEDSRLKGYNGKITHPTLPLERTFCSKCGAPFGWVSTESYHYIEIGAVTVFCNDCEQGMNAIGGVPLKVAAGQDATVIPPPPQGLHNQALRKGSLPSRLGED